MTAVRFVARLDARRAVYLVAALISLSFAYDLMRMPIELPDSLAQFLEVQESPSVFDTFMVTAQRSAYLRPMFLAEVHVLYDLAQGHYWLVFRGFHALLLVAGVLLFTRALQVHTWPEGAAAVFALTVFTGLHTFRGLVREGFPVPHFLVVAVLCLLALNLAQGRVAPRPDEPGPAGRSACADRYGGWWVDLAAVATFLVASLTLESGLLVWVILVAAWASGMRGVSRRGLIAVTALFVSYFLLRFLYFSNGTPGLEERSSGFLTSILEPEELVRRFGANPMWFYAYNVVTSMLSVLFSDPDGGVFEIARARLQGDVPPRLYVGVVSSVMATALIAWAVVARLRGRVSAWPGGGDQLLVVSGAVLLGNAAMSYGYTKHEIISVAGVFYGLAAYVAGCHVLEWMQVRQSGALRAAAVVMVAFTASIWAFRSAGVHHMLRVHAFKQRGDWAWVPLDMLRDRGSEENRRAAALVRQLRHDALEMRGVNPYLLPRWADRWWGE